LAIARAGYVTLDLEGYRQGSLNEVLNLTTVGAPVVA
jgi:PP-loop superfamily ATP-utilizing enzyme